MQLERLNEIFRAKLSDEDFKCLSEFIYREYGIKLPPAKKVMLQGRLQKRLRELDITSFREYVDYVFSEQGQDEVIHMIDVVSTNKTDFFREPVHFEFLAQEIVPLFARTTELRYPMKIWSAGCSSGEEPYTVAIVLMECREKYPTLDFQILGTDVSTRILQTALDAIYKENRIEGIPLQILKKYFLRSKDRTNPTVRLIPEIRRKVSYMRLNLMESVYPVPDMYDVIFCRNVLIYFDRPTQERVINKLCMYLKPGGYFFLGHSESIMGMTVPLRQIKPTIFVKIE
ncbi:MAG: CheR family methyltransferase [Bacteroidales bacterium]